MVYFVLDSTYSHIYEWNIHTRTAAAAAAVAIATTETAISAFSIRVKYSFFLLRYFYMQRANREQKKYIYIQIIWCLGKLYVYKMRIKWPIESAIAINICEQLNSSDRTKLVKFLCTCCRWVFSILSSGSSSNICFRTIICG